MIALRWGTAWQHEPGAPARDSVRLELDGLNVVPRADQEALGPVLASFVTAMNRLRAGYRHAQVSLENAQVEVCLRALGAHCELVVLEGRGVQQTLACRTRVDLAELDTATRESASTLARALPVDESERQALERALHPDRPLTPAASLVSPVRHYFIENAGLQAWLCDTEGRLDAFAEDPGNTHAVLLIPGALGDARGTTAPGPILLPLLTKLVQRPDRPTRELVQRLCTVLFASEPSLVRHPLLREAFARSVPPPAPTSRAAVQPLPPPELPTDEPALTPQGTPARLQFTQSRLVPLPLAFAWSKLTRVPSAHVVTSMLGAAVIGSRARKAQLVEAAHGAVVSETGSILVSEGGRAFALTATTASAHWVRNDRAGLLLKMVRETPTEWLVQTNHGVSAVSRLTGRERWYARTAPRVRSLIDDGQTLLTVSDHEVVALDAQTGQPRWQLRDGATLATQRDGGFCLISSGPDSTLCDTRDGATGHSLQRWLIDGHAIDAEAHGDELWLLVWRDETLRHVRVSEGRVIGDRLVPFAGRTARFSPVRLGALIHDINGLAMRLNADGSVRWLLGALDDSLNRPLRCVEIRKTTIVAGTRLRVVDSQRGTVLAETEARPHLVDFTVDAKLTLSLLTPGAFEQLKLSGTLQVVTP